MTIRVVKVQEEIDPDNIKAAMKASWLSGRELNRRLHLHGNYLSRLTEGKIQSVDVDFLDRLAEALVGEGQFAGKTKETVLSVLRGEAPVPLRGTLEVHTGRKRNRKVAATDEASIGYFRLIPFDLRKDIGWIPNLCTN